MLAFSTSSGARYVLDGLKMVRLEGPEIENVSHADGIWHELKQTPNLTVGYPAVFQWADGRFRITSTVVSIDENVA